MCHHVYMYVAVVPNRSSPPAVLLRESFRQDGKVHNRTVANISSWPPDKIEALRRVLKGATATSAPVNTLQILRSQPHGHVAATVGSLQKLGLDRLLDSAPSRQRDLVVAMIVARILDPSSKLATARSLDPDTLSNSLGEFLGLQKVQDDDLYRAMDWLLERQHNIEDSLAKRHFTEGGLVLYDLTSTYFEGSHCDLAHLGHSRDDKGGKPQIVFGLLTDAAGCPVAVEVFEGNTSDPRTVPAQVKKLRGRFGLKQVVFVGDRGMITSARLREDFTEDGLSWITALRATSIQKLAADGALQPSLFDIADLAEITDPGYPNERLVACFNPVLSARRAHKRDELLQATEKELEKVAVATRREKRPLRGRHNIGLRAGRVLGRFKMGKHYTLHIEDDSFRYERKPESIDREKKLDGIYVIRTNVKAEAMSAPEVVRGYKQLSNVERAFRSLKTVDLKVRPIHHRMADRVRAHVFLCMLAYYVEWHMRRKLAPLLFEDDDKEAAGQQRDSVVKPARRSPAADSKAGTKHNEEGLPVHSFRSLLADLATLTLNRIQPGDPDLPTFQKLSNPTPIHTEALSLLGVKLHLPVA
jgi:transposase